MFDTNEKNPLNGKQPRIGNALTKKKVSAEEMDDYFNNQNIEQ